MRKLTVLLLFLTVFFATSNATVPKTSAGRVTYKVSYNGKISETGGITVTYLNNTVRIDRAGMDGVKIQGMPSETGYIDYAGQKVFQVADLNSGKRISTEQGFDKLPKLEMTQETEKILGYTCKKAQTVIRSNKIEIWFTEESGLKGSPSPASGLPNGIVLKIVRNGNYAEIADKIEMLKPNKMKPLLPESVGEVMEAPYYRQAMNESLVTTVQIFKDEQLSFGNPINNPDSESGATLHYSGGTVIVKKVKLPSFQTPYDIFAELTQYSNGDAYDRTGSVFVIPVSKSISFLDALQKGIATLPVYKDRQGKAYQGVVATDNYEPPVELISFFTPFGIRHFNNQVKVAGITWEDSVVYRQEVTRLKSLLSGEVWIGVFIGNYDKGGHKVSLKLKYHPSESTTVSKQWAKPLFCTNNLMEMSGQEYGTMFKDDSLKVDFEVPQGVKNIQLQYISTGHGGWDQGDEFVPKLNQIFVDGQNVYGYTPWRCDCGTFRKYNPASGNFWNGLSSSDLSRSGWCPGTSTNPVFIPLNNLKPGKHQMKVAIPIGEREGGSFSSWCVSGVLTGEIE